MRQDREREAGKEKHSHAEHRVRIFDRHTCSLVRFGLCQSRKAVFLLQLLHFSFVLDRVVHLPVPSENVSRRGKKIQNVCRADGSCESGEWLQTANLERKRKEMNLTERAAETRQTSGETGDERVRVTALRLSLTVDYSRAP
jgi:hypothetical protein